MATDRAISGENRASSLEDLVGHFDQKVTSVLRDLDATTQQMAPVQVRTEEQVMSESQVSRRFDAAATAAFSAKMHLIFCFV